MPKPYVGARNPGTSGSPVSNPTEMLSADQMERCCNRAVADADSSEMLRRRLAERRRRSGGSGRQRKRVGGSDLEAFSRHAEHCLKVEQRRDQRQRVASGDVRLLAGAHARELDVHVARVAGVAPPLDHVQQAIGVERVTSRERQSLARGERPRVGRVGVECDRRPRKLIPDTRGLQPKPAPREFAAGEAWENRSGRRR